MATGGSAGSSVLAGAAAVIAVAALGVAIVRGGGRDSLEGNSNDVLTDPVSMENRLNAAEGRIEEAEKRLAEVEVRLGRLERTPRSAAGGSGGGAEGMPPPPAPILVEEGPVPVPADPAEKRRQLDLLLAAIAGGDARLEALGGIVARAQDLGGLDEALAAVEKQSALHPGNVDLLVALGLARELKFPSLPEAERKAGAEKAVEAYGRALEINPSHWEAQARKAILLLDWPVVPGRRYEAILVLEKLAAEQERIAPEPRFAGTYLHLASALEQEGNRDRAKEILRRGLDQFPGDPELRASLDALGK